MAEKLKEELAAVSHINEWLNLKTQDAATIPLSVLLKFDGIEAKIIFLGTTIWSSELDERYPGESLFTYLKITIIEIIKNLSEIVK